MKERVEGSQKTRRENERRAWSEEEEREVRGAGERQREGERDGGPIHAKEK